MLRVLLGLLLVAGPAWAEGRWPALHSVTGVAASDTLNVRAAPRAGSAIIGSFAPDATGIEVIAPAPGAPRWGIVNLGERSGYVALRFLDRISDTGFDTELPITACFGTEPFWTVTLSPGRLVLRELAIDGTVGVAVGDTIRAPNDLRVQALSGQEGGTRLTLIARQSAPDAFCRDGMSDATFGIDATVLVDRGDGPSLLAGCCSIAR